MTLRNAFDNLATDSSAQGIRTDLGTDGASPPVIAGTGVRGWLRAIYDKLVGGITVTNFTDNALTNTQLRAAAVPVSVASVPSHPVTNAGTFSVQVTAAPTTAVTGAFYQATQPVSMASQPLPTGAATETSVSNTFISLGNPSTSAAATDTTSPWNANSLLKGILAKLTGTLSIQSPFSNAGSVPSTAMPVGGSDGTLMRTLSTDTTGKLNVNVAPLPTGSNVIGIVRAAGQTTAGASVVGLSPILSGMKDNAGNMATLNGDSQGNLLVAAPGSASESTLDALLTSNDTNMLTLIAAINTLNAKVVAIDTTPVATDTTAQAISALSDTMLYMVTAMLDKMPRLDRIDRVVVDLSDYGIGGSSYASSFTTGVNNPVNGASFYRQMEPWNFSDAGSTRIYQQITVGP